MHNKDDGKMSMFLPLLEKVLLGVHLLCVDLNEKSTPSFLGFFPSYFLSQEHFRGPPLTQARAASALIFNSFSRKNPIELLRAAANPLPRHEEADPRLHVTSRRVSGD